MFTNIRKCYKNHPNYLECCWKYEESIKRQREIVDIGPSKNKLEPKYKKILEEENSIESKKIKEENKIEN